jgi:sulfatase modifying factor 1
MLRSSVVILLAASGCELAVSLAHFDDGCPPARGPAAVRIHAGSASYCIDSTEVTNAEYQDFLSAIGAAGPSGAPSVGCEQEPSLTPKENWPPAPGTETFPVVHVDWCQASAYCAWAGKRLCGRIGGGALAVGGPEHDAAQSQWFNACTMGGARAYPYGASFDMNACGGPLETVGARAQCIGGYPGIYDMNGSVWEWNDACDSAKPDSFCHAYGGAFDSTPEELACAVTPRPWTRSAGAANIGIRCCQDR